MFDYVCYSSFFYFVLIAQAKFVWALLDSFWSLHLNKESQRLKISSLTQPTGKGVQVPKIKKHRVIEELKYCSQKLIFCIYFMSYFVGFRLKAHLSFIYFYFVSLGSVQLKWVKNPQQNGSK